MDRHPNNRRSPVEIRVLPTKGDLAGTDILSTDYQPDEIFRIPITVADRGDTRHGEGNRHKGSKSDDYMRAVEKLARTSGDTESTGLRLILKTWGVLSQAMRKPIRKFLLISSGPIGTAVISMAALWSVLHLIANSGTWQLEALGGLLLIRLLYHLTRGPVPVLVRHRIRKQLGWVIADEVQISVAFLAGCFLMSWPIDLITVQIFVAVNLAAQIGMLGYSRFVVRRLTDGVYDADPTEFARRAVILGTGRHAQRVADMVMESPDLDTKLVGFLDYQKAGMWRYRDVPLIGHPEKLGTVVSSGQVDAVFVAVDPEDIQRSRSLFDSAERMGVPVFVMPNIYYPTVSRIRPSFVNGMPALVYRSAPENRLALFVKNILDRIGALVILAVASPVMAVAALSIKLDSRGPVLFRQVRTGINGRTFDLLKFRTMCVDAEERKERLAELNEMSGPVFKIRKDPRVTRVGQFLRKFSIDELPQLINVLRGEMSLVGPRPPLPNEVADYMPWQHRRLSVKPGVTCLWQVNGRNEVSFEDWMRMDLEYIDNWSLWLDMKILARTVPAVLKGSGV